MLTAIFTDIHGNREAFEACLAHARAKDIGGYVFLGDYVGYGADPGFIVDTVMVSSRAARSRCSAIMIPPSPARQRT